MNSLDKFFATTDVEVLESVQVEEKATDVHQLTIFNDDYNTFQHVINALIDICSHTNTQAEQCALITHYKGKCSVKSGEFEKLKPMRNAICDRGISAEIL